jgi:uncharacterized coiled-coil protein SlyX
MTPIPTDPPGDKAVVWTAELIPFRGRQGVERVWRPVGQAEAQARLAQALDALNAALVEQRTAMAAWRAALGELKDSTIGLANSLEQYRANLAALGRSVSSLKAQAKALQAWAETNRPG